MTSNGQGPSPQPEGGAQRRHGRGHDARRRDAGSPWGLPAAASPRDRSTSASTRSRERRSSWAARLGAPTRPARPGHDDPGADFVLQAMQRAYR